VIPILTLLFPVVSLHFVSLRFVSLLWFPFASLRVASFRFTFSPRFALFPFVSIGNLLFHFEGKMNRSLLLFAADQKEFASVSLSFRFKKRTAHSEQNPC
jgi:hypothetical protein